jgi:asparagine synthase (glutamine-hydrolysing)
MCGILGIYNLTKNQQTNSGKFEKALLKMNHRGPDAFDVKNIDSDILLGHLRLSIIDLSNDGNQPFTLDDRYSIIFNGEIYNYIELREELIQKGLEFSTKTDTEVLLKSYTYWGENCVNKLNGMWAFAIYDRTEKTLFCSRDRFGVKPFNYAIHNNQFIFGSEIKSILEYFPELKQPNLNAIANFCFSSVGAQHKETWFKSIYRLEPAHHLTIKNGEIKITRYWDYPKKTNTNISFENAVDHYRSLFFDAVKIRLRSDVPLGFTLSSGIDSTSIVSIIGKENHSNTNTYTAAFNSDDYKKTEKQNFRENVTINEAEIVKQLTDELNLRSNIIPINFDNYTDNLQKIIYHLESGHGSPATYPLYEILKVANKDVTVVLEGQGADELLAGYINTAFPIYFIELIKNFKFKTAYNELQEFKKTYSLITAFKLAVRQSNFKFLKNYYYKLSGIDNFLSKKLSKSIELKDYPTNPQGFDNELNNHLFKAHTGGLVNLLHYGDAISMAHSLESRLPFMDYRLVEFIFSLPSSYKIRNGLGKYIHRVAMKGILPDYILENKLKFGFDSPLAQLFCLDGEKSPAGILLSDKCIQRGLFNAEKIKLALTEQKNETKDHSRLLFRLLSVELWYRNFID